MMGALNGRRAYRQTAQVGMHPDSDRHTERAREREREGQGERHVERIREKITLLNHDNREQKR